ncbi:MAG: hypothetical protein R3C11_27140 [Planctomycetaceae bacterium]
MEDDSPDVSDFQRTHGLSGYVIKFSSMFQRFKRFDRQRAQKELEFWPVDEETVFARLRFWAGGYLKLLTPHQFFRSVINLSDHVFWGSYHQRDLLLSLNARWNELSEKDRQKLEKRLLTGPSQWKKENDEFYQERRALEVLRRLEWLKESGCRLLMDFDSESKLLREVLPEWKKEMAYRAVRSREMRGGMVSTDTDCKLLLQEPFNNLIQKAKELSGRSETNFLLEHDPFTGLCIDHPKRAYLALKYADREHDVDTIEQWRTFLHSFRDKPPDSRLIHAVALRLHDIDKFEDEKLKELLYQVTWWLEKVSLQLSEVSSKSFDNLVGRIIEFAENRPTLFQSDVHRSNRGRYRLNESINSPIGNLTMAIVKDKRLDGDSINTVSRTLATLQRCLSIAGNPRQHSITILCHDLEWFYRKSSDWTEQYLLSIIEKGENAEDQDAFWAGLFWNPDIYTFELFQEIKPALLELVNKVGKSSDSHTRSIASLLLRGWFSVDGKFELRQLSSDEFRETLLAGSDELRSHVLWKFVRGLRDENALVRKDYRVKARVFFEEVWPRQKIVKTSQMTARLCEILLAHPKAFSVLFPIISPLLTKLIDRQTQHFFFHSDNDAVIKESPCLFLDFLDIVLSDDVYQWPHGTDDAIYKIVEVDKELATDSTYLRLERKLKSR